MNDQTQTATPTVQAIEQGRQNGVLRPFPGTKTGLVWDYADAIYAERQKQGFKHAVPVISEVSKLYDNVIGAVPATCRQQFQFWKKYHGLKPAWEARIAEEGNETDAAKIEAKKAKDAAKLLKAQEAARKATERAEKQRLDAEARVKKAQELAEKAQKDADAAKAKANEMLSKATAAASAAQASTAPAAATPTPAPAAQTEQPAATGKGKAA
jgi:hypothetical protein